VGPMATCSARRARTLEPVWCRIRTTAYNPSRRLPVRPRQVWRESVPGCRKWRQLFAICAPPVSASGLPRCKWVTRRCASPGRRLDRPAARKAIDRGPSARQVDRSGPDGASATGAPSGHLVLHLGMSGQLKVLAADAPQETHTHFVLDLEDAQYATPLPRHPPLCSALTFADPVDWNAFSSEPTGPEGPLSERSLLAAALAKTTAT